MKDSRIQKNPVAPRPKCGRSTFMPYSPVMNVSGMNTVAITVSTFITVFS